MRQLILLLFVIPLLGGCATAPAPLHAPLAPGPWKHVASKDYEREQPGLGYSRRFDAPQGWADLYGYDLRKTWLDGLDDPEFEQLEAATVGEVLEAGRRGVYRNVKASPAETITLANTPLRYVRFHYNNDQGSIESRLYLTCIRGRIMKLRVSLREPLHPDTSANVEGFVADRIRGFHSERIVSTAKEPNGPRPVRKLAIDLNPAAMEGSTEQGGCALAFLLSRARYFDERGVAFLQAGERIPAGYADEVEAFTVTVQVTREMQEAGKAIPAYWQHMQAVEAAGFLREYIVLCRQRPVSLADAASLRLAEFRTWAVEHLQGVDHTEVDRYGSIGVSP